MITPFQVYLVMQLDSINATLTFLSILLGLAGLFCLIFFLVALVHEDDAIASSFRRVMKPVLISFFSLLTITTIIPSSKTAAAMIVLPAITSDKVTEPLTAEAKELYGLAKSALSNLAEKKAEKVEPEKAK